MAYSKIYKTAKKSIYYIDNYVGLKTLDLLSNAKNNIDIDSEFDLGDITNEDEGGEEQWASSVKKKKQSQK